MGAPLDLRSVEQKEINVKYQADGLIGKKTIAASKKIDVARLQVYRILYYTNLINRKPKLSSFIVGWIRRAMEVPCCDCEKC